MDITTSTPSIKSQATLAVLRVAIAKTLDKKQRLGQYAVVWQDGRPVLTGPDAPQQAVTATAPVGHVRNAG